MANPYVTIPAGPDWYQQQYYDAYLKSYMQPQQPSWWEQMLAGLTHGLGQTAPIMQKNFEAQAGLDTRLLTEQMQQQGAMDRLQYSTDAQLKKWHEIEQAKMLAEQQKQLMEGMSQHAFLKGVSTPEMMPQAPGQMDIPYHPDREDRAGYSTSAVPTGYTASVGGAEPPTYDYGQRPATTLDAMTAIQAGQFPGRDTLPTATEQPPTAYTDILTQTAQTPNAAPLTGTAATAAVPRDPIARQRSVQEVLAALGPAVVGIPDSLIKNVLEMQKAPAADKLPAELVKIAVGEIEAGRPQNAMNILAKIGQPDLLTSMTPKPETAKPEQTGLGSISTDPRLTAIALGHDTTSPLARDLAAGGKDPALVARQMLDDEQNRLLARQKAAGVAQAETLDMRQRAKEVDEARRDFSTISKTLPALEAAVAKSLEPGVMGRIKGGVKATVHEWTQAYPELEDLVTMSTVLQGAISRRVLLESGVLAQFDVSRAARLLPKASDRYEVAVAKLRVLKQFIGAAGQAWQEYEASGLSRAPRDVNAFLPPDFWNQTASIAEPQQYRVGETVTLEGKTVTVDRVNPDGSFHGVDPYGKGYTWRP
jgi:hypothetical protein